MNQKKEPQPNPQTQQESDDEDTRTEFTAEYLGAKLGGKVGRGGSMLLWAIAWAILVLSTMLGFGLLVSALKNAGVLGCVSLLVTYCAANILALSWPWWLR